MSLKDRLRKIESRPAKVVQAPVELDDGLMEYIMFGTNEDVYKNHPFFDRKARTVDKTKSAYTDAFIESIINGK